MKTKSLAVLCVAATMAVVSQASHVRADTISIRAGESTVLPSCQGTLEVSVELESLLKLVFHDVVNCSNVSILNANGTPMDYPAKKLYGPNHSRSGTLLFPKSLMNFGQREFVVLVTSNSGRTSDQVRVKFDATPADTITVNQKKELTECGGTIEVRVSESGLFSEQVNVVFRNVENCSNFDIASANGLALEYPNKKLSIGSDGKRHGSFTIPDELIREGMNRITISIQSNSGVHHDIVTVKFEAVLLPPWLRMQLAL